MPGRVMQGCVPPGCMLPGCVMRPSGRALRHTIHTTHPPSPSEDSPDALVAVDAPERVRADDLVAALDGRLTAPDEVAIVRYGSRR